MKCLYSCSTSDITCIIKFYGTKCRLCENMPYFKAYLPSKNNFNETKGVKHVDMESAVYFDTALLIGENKSLHFFLMSSWLLHIRHYRELQNKVFIMASYVTS